MCRWAPSRLTMQHGGCSSHQKNAQGSHTAMQVGVQPLPKPSDSGLSAITEGKHEAAMKPIRASRGPRPRMHVGKVTGQQAEILPGVAPTKRVTVFEGRLLNVPDRARTQPVDVSDSDDDSGAWEDPNSWWDLDNSGIVNLPPCVQDEDLAVARSLIGAECSSKIPEATEVLSDPPIPYFGVHIRSLELGMVVPLHPFLVRFLHFLGVAPGQLAPAAHMFVAAFVARCEDVGLTPTIDLFFSCFQWRASNFFASVSQRPVSKLFRSGYPDSGSRWKKRWIWVSDPTLPSPPFQWGERLRKCDRVALSPDLKSSIEVLSAGGPRSISSYLDVPDRPEKHIAGAESDDDDEEAQPFIARVAPTATKEKEHGAPPNLVAQIPRRVRVTFGPQPAAPAKKKQKRDIVDLLVELDESDDEEVEPHLATAPVAPQVAAGTGHGAPLGREGHVLEGATVTPEFQSAGQAHEDAGEKMAERVRCDTQHTVVYTFPSPGASIMHEGFPVVDYASAILPPGDLARMTSQGFQPLLEDSIRTHVDGLAKTIGALWAANHSQAKLQREVDEVRAALQAREKAFSELQLLHAREREEVAKKAILEFKASDEFQKTISDRVEAKESDLVNKWLKTDEGEYWHAREVLYAFQCGKYLTQRKLYDQLEGLGPDFYPSVLGLPARMKKPEAAIALLPPGVYRQEEESGNSNEWCWFFPRPSEDMVPLASGQQEGAQESGQDLVAMLDEIPEANGNGHVLP
ncbi:unnamed protein product [Cuscuta epithymum]|uniref:Transposase (putative) gypsy type domain-containing protein n=1 Tax=Cuscuta epithymum TaxID=186058 RepID=A0AAV0F0M8_9ASTE|nr:unnamed protein product [Cuscuta epithymum]